MLNGSGSLGVLSNKINNIRSLTVNDNLTNARSLYEKVGFRLQYTGVHTKKLW